MRNIVLITWDSIRANHCSCYGYGKETTPFLDFWARKGVIFENAINGLRVTIRDKEWKLIVNPDREDELYNIKKDSMEQENLIGQEPDIEKELRKLAEKHIKTSKEKERVRGRIKRISL